MEDACLPPLRPDGGSKRESGEEREETSMYFNSAYGKIQETTTVYAPTQVGELELLPRYHRFAYQEKDNRAHFARAARALGGRVEGDEWVGAPFHRFDLLTDRSLESALDAKAPGTAVPTATATTSRAAEPAETWAGDDGSGERAHHDSAGAAPLREAEGDDLAGSCTTWLNTAVMAFRPTVEEQSDAVERAHHNIHRYLTAAPSPLAPLPEQQPQQAGEGKDAAVSWEPRRTTLTGVLVDQSPSSKSDQSPQFVPAIMSSSVSFAPNWPAALPTNTPSATDVGQTVEKGAGDGTTNTRTGVCFPSSPFSSIFKSGGAVRLRDFEPRVSQRGLRQLSSRSSFKERVHTQGAVGKNTVTAAVHRLWPEDRFREYMRQKMKQEEADQEESQDRTESSEECSSLSVGEPFSRGTDAATGEAASDDNVDPNREAVRALFALHKAGKNVPPLSVVASEPASSPCSGTEKRRSSPTYPCLPHKPFKPKGPSPLLKNLVNSRLVPHHATATAPQPVTAVFPARPPTGASRQGAGPRRATNPFPEGQLVPANSTGVLVVTPEGRSTAYAQLRWVIYDEAFQRRLIEEMAGAEYPVPWFGDYALDTMARGGHCVLYPVNLTCDDDINSRVAGAMEDFHARCDSACATHEESIAASTQPRHTVAEWYRRLYGPPKQPEPIDPATLRVRQQARMIDQVVREKEEAFQISIRFRDTIRQRLALVEEEQAARLALLGEFASCTWPEPCRCLRWDAEVLEMSAVPLHPKLYPTCVYVSTVLAEYDVLANSLLAESAALLAPLKELQEQEFIALYVFDRFSEDEALSFRHLCAFHDYCMVLAAYRGETVPARYESIAPFPVLERGPYPDTAMEFPAIADVDGGNDAGSDAETQPGRGRSRTSEVDLDEEGEGAQEDGEEGEEGADAPSLTEEDQEEDRVSQKDTEPGTEYEVDEESAVEAAELPAAAEYPTEANDQDHSNTPPVDAAEPEQPVTQQDIVDVEEQEEEMTGDRAAGAGSDDSQIGSVASLGSDSDEEEVMAARPDDALVVRFPGLRDSPFCTLSAFTELFVLQAAAFSDHERLERQECRARRHLEFQSRCVEKFADLEGEEAASRQRDLTEAEEQERDDFMTQCAAGAVAARQAEHTRKARQRELVRIEKALATLFDTAPKEHEELAAPMMEAFAALHHKEATTRRWVQLRDRQREEGNGSGTAAKWSFEHSIVIIENKEVGGRERHLLAEISNRALLTGIFHITLNELRERLEILDSENLTRQWNAFDFIEGFARREIGDMFAFEQEMLFSKIVALADTDGDSSARTDYGGSTRRDARSSGEDVLGTGASFDYHGTTPDTGSPMTWMSDGEWNVSENPHAMPASPSDAMNRSNIWELNTFPLYSRYHPRRPRRARSTLVSILQDRLHHPLNTAIDLQRFVLYGLHDFIPEDELLDLFTTRQV